MPLFEEPPPLSGRPSTELSKPKVPYISRYIFNARSHEVPAPTRVLRDCCINSEGDKKEREYMSLVERCIKRPPLPGREGSDTITLQVIQPLNAGDGHNSQVLMVQLLGSTSQFPFLKSTKLVAKIYDPLYFNDQEGYLNPFLCMDKYYTHEANTYKVLSELQGQSIPRYYGSYSLNLSVGSERMRVVRMILVEHIQGIVMSQAEPREFSQLIRKGIMKSTVDLEGRIFKKNILLADLEPRNVMIVSPESDHPHVFFIDFGDALFNRTRDDHLALQLNNFLDIYISPLLRWKSIRDKEWPFSEWLDWHWDTWLEAQFADTAADITPDMRQRWPDENE